MSPVDWSTLFEAAYPELGASEADLHFLVQSLQRPISQAELGQIQQRHARWRERHPSSVLRFHPTSWRIPGKPLPQSYLDFLRWSNGGAFGQGERWFDRFFTTGEVRGYMLAYDVPEHLPGAVPFAFDGSGTFYLFDMREQQCAGEYPILISHASHLGFGPTACRQIASTFVEACTGRTAPVDILGSGLM
jgi:hypothetical protein